MHVSPVELAAGVAILLGALWLGCYGAQQTLGRNDPKWDRTVAFGLTPRGIAANLGLCAVLAFIVLATSR